MIEPTCGKGGAILASEHWKDKRGGQSKVNGTRVVCVGVGKTCVCAGRVGEGESSVGGLGEGGGGFCVLKGSENSEWVCTGIVDVKIACD